MKKILYLFERLIPFLILLMCPKTSYYVKSIIFNIIDYPSLPDLFHVERHSEFKMSAGRHIRDLINMLIEQEIGGIIHRIQVYFSQFVILDFHPLTGRVSLLVAFVLRLKYKF